MMAAGVIGVAASGRVVGVTCALVVAVQFARRGAGTKLVDQDSNLDKQNQNLLCYRYTIDQ